MPEIRTPIAETFERLAALNDSLDAEVGDLVPGFVPINKLIQFRETSMLSMTLTEHVSHIPMVKPIRLASIFIADYVWIITAAAIGAYLLEQRIPDLLAENMALQVNLCTSHREKQIAVRFLSGCFACLPDDPDANHPDAVVLHNSRMLMNWMCERLTSHLQPLLRHGVSLVHPGTSNVSKSAIKYMIAGSTNKEPELYSPAH